MKYIKDLYIPNEAEEIISELERAGYEAYIVGGCVRDCLLGKSPDDYDITTSAKPDEVKKLFTRTVDTGLAHGTVTVVKNSKPFEVTTFRIDGEYKDNRHPTTVEYTDNVKLDLARRDFTVNAMAYNHIRGLVDVFGGVEDLKNGIIRTVGKAEDRFSEDALRVLRAIRFSSTLGFKIEEKTSLAIKKHAHALLDISSERIYTEWKKLLSGKGAYEIINEYSDVIATFAPELGNIPKYDRSRFLTLTSDERQLLLFLISNSCNLFGNFAKRLKTDKKTKERGISVLNNMTISDETDDDGIKRFLIGKNDETVDMILNVSYGACKISSCTRDRIKAIAKMGLPRFAADLNIKGEDLISIGISGKEIGSTLSNLVVAAAIGDVENENAALMSYVISHR